MKEPAKKKIWLCALTIAALGALAAISALYFPKMAPWAVALAAVVLLLNAINAISKWDAAESAQRRKELERLRKRAELDPMTGLLNCRAIRAGIEEYLDREGRRGRHALMMIDLDHFKQVNDTMGHPYGDMALKAAAARIKAAFRTDDLVGRNGGDEFMVFMKDVGDAENVKRKAAELRERLTGAMDGENGSALKMTASTGVAMSGEEARDYVSLYQRADRALYLVKARGRDGFALYEENTICLNRTDYTDEDAHTDIRP